MAEGVWIHRAVDTIRLGAANGPDDAKVTKVKLYRSRF